MILILAISAAYRDQNPKVNIFHKVTMASFAITENDIVRGECILSTKLTKHTKHNDSPTESIHAEVVIVNGYLAGHG